jgi:lipoprotein-anchoring transpeptidase ErfK/SrfK
MVTVANVSTRGKTHSKAARILVDKRERTLRLLGPRGKLIAFFPASVGGPDKPNPNGLLRVTQTVTNPSYTYSPEFNFKGVEAWGKFKIMPSLNNPVGLVWIGLNRRGYGIHGSPEPDGVSEAASHGCARLTNWDALRLIRLIRRGTPVKFVN